jgi:hypothetical protein
MRMRHRRLWLRRRRWLLPVMGRLLAHLLAICTRIERGPSQAAAFFDLPGRLPLLAFRRNGEG